MRTWEYAQMRQRAERCRAEELRRLYALAKRALTEKLGKRRRARDCIADAGSGGGGQPALSISRAA